MSLLLEKEDNDEDYVFMAKIDNAKNVLHLLKAINFKEVATVYGSTKGLKVTVEDSKCIQANAFIQAEMFQEYDIKEEIVTFKINLNVLVECLSIFGGGGVHGGTPALKMCYKGYGFPLKLLLEEGGVLTDCSVKTQDPDDILDFSFCNTDVVNKMIMKSECLKELFTELDMSSDTMEIYLSQDAPYFRISTFGNYGINYTDVPKDSDMFESFNCTRTTKNRYKTSLMKPAIKPLGASQKVLIRCDNRGFICFQFLIKTEDNHTCFVEYFCSPEEDYDDEE